MNEIFRVKVFRGYKGDGTLVITDECLYWNKSGSSYLKFGLINTMTDKHIHCSYENIGTVVLKKGLGRDGVIITTKQGEQLDFYFKKKLEAKEVYEYLCTIK
ncbi:MAG: hypothetical protein ACK5L6_13595 [Anaerorhabdus sp.]|uniref:hypothetical protein n=1 Tax=Anaerorhabdus sp. TaxID=1872524 RepID=UPI003A870263